MREEIESDEQEEEQEEEVVVHNGESGGFAVSLLSLSFLNILDLSSVLLASVGGGDQVVGNNIRSSVTQSRKASNSINTTV